MNPLKPRKALLKDIREEARDIKTYTFLVDDGFPKTPQPGQFNMLGYPGIGEAPISFSGLWEKGTIAHTIRNVGMATSFLANFMNGGEVLLRGPYGKGWPMDALSGRDLLIVAGGLGIAPLRPVIHEIMKRRSDFGNVVVLVGSRNEDGLVFVNEYDEWRKALSLRITVDELVTKKPWNHHVGLITELLDDVSFNVENMTVFVCGPEIMMRFVCKNLLMRGTPAGDLYVSLERRMKCGIAQCGHCQHVGLFVCKDGPVFSYEQVAGLYDGLL